MLGCTQWLYLPAFFQEIFTHKCFYGSRTRIPKSGCARYCNVTVEVRRVKSGWHLGHQDSWNSQLWSQVCCRNLECFPKWVSNSEVGRTLRSPPTWITALWVPLPFQSPWCLHKSHPPPKSQISNLILPRTPATASACFRTFIQMCRGCLPLPNPSCHNPMGPQTPSLHTTTPFQQSSSWHLPSPGMF